jgi:hypothetical protein
MLSCGYTLTGQSGWHAEISTNQSRSVRNFCKPHIISTLLPYCKEKSAPSRANGGWQVGERSGAIPEHDASDALILALGSWYQCSHK